MYSDSPRFRSVLQTSDAEVQTMGFGKIGCEDAREAVLGKTRPENANDGFRPPENSKSRKNESVYNGLPPPTPRGERDGPPAVDRSGKRVDRGRLPTALPGQEKASTAQEKEGGSSGSQTTLTAGNKKSSKNETQKQSKIASDANESRVQEERFPRILRCGVSKKVHELHIQPSADGCDAKARSESVASTATDATGAENGGDAAGAKKKKTVKKSSKKGEKKESAKDSAAKHESSVEEAALMSTAASESAPAESTKTESRKSSKHGKKSSSKGKSDGKSSSGSLEGKAGDSVAPVTPVEATPAEASSASGGLTADLINNAHNPAKSSFGADLAKVSGAAERQSSPSKPVFSAMLMDPGVLLLCFLVMIVSAVMGAYFGSGMV